MTERPAKTWTIMQVLEWTRGHFENKGLASPASTPRSSSPTPWASPG